MKAGCSPHSGALKGGLEEHQGEANMTVDDGRGTGTVQQGCIRRGSGGLKGGGGLAGTPLFLGSSYGPYRGQAENFQV